MWSRQFRSVWFSLIEKPRDPCGSVYIFPEMLYSKSRVTVRQPANVVRHFPQENAYFAEARYMTPTLILP
jgi:hypothetical protein